jgi:hypothetical protein
VSDVRWQRNLKIPAGAAYGALREILRAIAAQEGNWRGFALHVSLGDLNLADFGYVAVPVCIVVGKELQDAHAVDLTLTAVNQPSSFPTFKGSLGVDAMGTSGSILWLGGGYDVPLHVFGKLLDATLAAGVAKRTLENFIDDIAAACTAFVERREAEYVRFRMFS